MTDLSRRLPAGGVAKARVLRARGLFSDLAGRVPDPARARRIEAELNDAWLRLQLALVADDLALARAQRRTCEALMSAALAEAGRAEGPDPGLA